MSARECISGSEEEEEMARRVGGRGRGLVQAVLRLRRERAGRTPQNLNLGQSSPNQRRLVEEEVGPHGHEVERRLGGLQTRGQQTITEETRDRPHSRVRARPSTPPPTPRLPYDSYSPPVGHSIAPHRCPHCEEIPGDIFPFPPYSATDSAPLPHYDDLFPPGSTPFPNHNTHLCPSFTTLPTPSIPLDPPPSYDSLFATAAPADSAVAPQVPLITGTTLIYGIPMLSWTGTCRSSLPVHPHTLTFT